MSSPRPARARSRCSSTRRPSSADARPRGSRAGRGSQQPGAGQPMGADDGPDSSDSARPAVSIAPPRARARPCLDDREGRLHGGRRSWWPSSARATRRRAPLKYTRKLAGELARTGAVIVSGGAVGIDGAAHQGALDAGGRTWVVAPTGHELCFPPEHQGLFDEIARGPGAMIWPFAPRAAPHRPAFLARNRVLVALADAVVVVQAGPRSGALHAASWARKLGKPLWVVPVAPWNERLRRLARAARQGSSPADINPPHPANARAARPRKSSAGHWRQRQGRGGATRRADDAPFRS